MKNEVLTTDKSGTVEKFGEKQQVFQDQTAPKLKAAGVQDGKLVLTFDEPVQGTDENAQFEVTVDGQEIEGFDIINDVVGQYKLISKNAYDFLDDLGEHTVVVFNAKDLVENNGNFGNKASQLSTTYTIKDNGAPTVTHAINDDWDSSDSVGVANSDFNSLEIGFSEEVTNAKVVVKKGSTVFYDQELNHVTGETIELPIEVPGRNGEKVFLYEPGQSSQDVTVTISNYRDLDGNVNNTFTKTVTLNKDAYKPAVTSKYDNFFQGNKLTLEFNRDLAKKAVDVNDIIVTDKAGIVRTVATAKTVANTLEITLENVPAKADLADLAPFKVQLAAGAVVAETDINDGPKPYGNNKATSTLANEAFTTDVYPTFVGEFKYKEAVESVAAQSKIIKGVHVNTITVTYDEKMASSAASLANYTLNGQALPAGSKLSIDASSKVVTITLPENYVPQTSKQRLEISKNVATATGATLVDSVATKEAYASELIDFTDNKRPSVAAAKFLVDEETSTRANDIIVTFSEEVTVTDATSVLNDLQVKIGDAELDVASVALYDDKDGNVIFK